MVDVVTKKISSMSTDEIYNITINKKNKTVTCTCLGFQSYGRCKHIRIYRDTIQRILYNEDYVQNIISNFKNCKELVLQLIENDPTLMYSYNDLVETVHKYKKYSTETITRTYRRLKEEGLIEEPEELSIKREKTEKIFHDINNWQPIVLQGKQTTIIDI